MLDAGCRTSRFETRAAMASGPETSTPTSSAQSPRALVPLHAAPEPGHSQPIAVRQQACFLAQLIATQEGLPQTRQRRREAAAVAAAAYAATAAALHHPVKTTAGRRL
jgi:hypothetical protein